MEMQQTSKKSWRKRGFVRASGLLEKRIRSASETRGFAVSRLLTHWTEIVGTETAQAARPIKISYGQAALGATLTVLTTGARAPMLQAELPKILEAVNRCYGYAAISRIRITQTAATGFAEGQVDFDHAKPEARQAPDPATVAKAKLATGDVNDDGLRAALERLGTNIITGKKP